MTYATSMVFQALRAGYRYGFDIAAAASLRPGAVYQILHRLEEAKLVTAHWEDADLAHRERRPPRRYYALKDAAEPLVEEARRRFPGIEHAPGEPRRAT
jgi:DNA-binding PadR family transcriptional regulator